MTRSLFSFAAALVAASMLAAPATARAQDLPLSPVPNAQDARELRLAVSRWSDGDPIPYGYHAEKRPRVGLLVAGSLTFAVPYALSAFMAVSSNKAELAVPVVGPFIAAVDTLNTPCSSWLCFRELNAGVTAAMGVVQAAGAAMLIAGAVGRYTLVVDEPGSVSVSPMVVPSGAGVGVSGQF
ncbi:MAG: hypothetical protein QM765_25955 [Myxococcales bacterium]